MSETQGRLRRRRMHLRTRQCERPAESSLFARLSPSVVASLHRDAWSCADTDPPQPARDGWNIRELKKAEQVDFLPLSLQFSADVTIYVSFNGGLAAVDPSSPTQGDAIIELPKSLVPKGFSDATEVRVAVLSHVHDAEMLLVEPLTHEDWELLETKAEFLEDGNLLQQVSLVHDNQIIPLWVGGNDIAWIRVLPSNFGDQNSQQWPDVVDDDGSANIINCCRLVQDTRISVTPKPRPRQKVMACPPLRVYPTYHDYSKPMHELAKSMGKLQLVATTPGTAWLHPSAKKIIPGMNEDDSLALVVVWNAALGMNGENSEGCVMQVAFSESVPELCIAIHQLTRSRLFDLNALVDHAFLRVLSPIEVARGPSMLQPNCVCVTRVEIQHTRRGKPWRYVEQLSEADAWSSQAVLDDNFLATLCDSEPVENGSFLFLSTDKGKALYRVSFEISHAGFQGKSNSDPASIFGNERPFLLLKQIPDFLRLDKQISVRKTNFTQVSIQDRSNAFVQSENFSLSSPTHMINLLPVHALTTLEITHCHEMKGTSDAIVCGESGSGKTHTALLLAAMSRFSNGSSVFYLDCKKLKESQKVRMAQIMQQIHGVFQEAAVCQENALVILDDLDKIAPKIDNEANTEDSAQSQQINPVTVDQAKLIGDFVQRFFEESSGSPQRVSVIVTCRNKRSIYPSILCCRPFTRIVEAPDLNAQERERLLLKLVDPFAERGFREASHIGRKTDGFRPRDLVNLASRIRHQQHCLATQMSPACLSDLADRALHDFTPLRQLAIAEGATGSAAWSDIGGLFEVKDVLTSTILHPAKYRRIYEKAKIRLPRGVLIFGFPGSGKSILVPALARKCGFSLITCRGPELLDRYIGASESKVRELFARASAASPSILFFDEIDSLAPRRGSDRTGVTDRVVNQLLTLLDGVEDSSAGRLVYVIAATSRPDIVDPALLRPGRLEKHVYVGYAQSDEECTDLISKIASDYAIDAVFRKSISSGNFVQDAKKLTSQFSRLTAADLKAAFDTAQLSAIHEHLKAGQMGELLIRGDHMSAALASTRPSLPERDYAMLMEAYRPFRKFQKSEEFLSEHKDLQTSLPTLRTALH